MLPPKSNAAPPLVSRRRWRLVYTVGWAGIALALLISPCMALAAPWSSLPIFVGGLAFALSLLSALPLAFCPHCRRQMWRISGRNASRPFREATCPRCGQRLK